MINEHEKLLLTHSKNQLMDTYNRIEYNSAKGIFFLILFTVLMIKSCAVQAQQTLYKGIATNFGVRSYTLTSDIPELNNLKVVQEGGNAGFIIGNDIIQARIHGLGYYYSSASTPRTVNTIEVEGLGNFYPVSAINRNYQGRFNPYVMGGVSQGFMKFHGNYLNNENVPVNYSSGSEPLLGKMSATVATMGMGLEYRMHFFGTFVHLFTEARFGKPVMIKADDVFSNTTLSNRTSVSVGVSFGCIR
jgi:hypothetical protein